MRCIMCNKGKLKEGLTEYEESGIFLGRFKANVCTNCGEAFFDKDTARKIQRQSKEKGLFGLSKKTRVALVGNSLAIRIPKEVAEFMKLKKKTEIKITPKTPYELIIETNH